MECFNRIVDSFFLDDIVSCMLIIAIIVVVGTFGLSAYRAHIKHIERLEKIKQGIDPDC